MTSPLNQEIKKWIEDNINHLSIHNPVSIHINELLGKELKKSEIIAVSLQTCWVLIEGLLEQQIQVRAGLVIPLVSVSKKIERMVPTDRLAMEEQLDLEPPSLYLLPWVPVEYLEVREEYLSPLTFDLIGYHLQGVYVFYREVRYIAAIENDWEFARGVYVEYYPGSTLS